MRDNLPQTIPGGAPMRRALLSLCACVLCVQVPALAEAPDLERGVRLVEQGSFAEAVATLEGAARRLEAQGGSEGERSRAWLYAGIARVGLGDETGGETAFRAAIAAQPSLRLDRRLYSDRVVEVFERASAGLLPPATVEPAGKGRAWPWVLGAGAAAGVGIAAVASGGGGGASPAPPAVDPRSVDDDGDGVSEAQGDCDDARGDVHPNGAVTVSPAVSTVAGKTVRCTQPVPVTITLTNLSCQSVLVSGIARNTKVRLGHCNAADPFTYRPDAGTVRPGQTAAVLDRPIYTGGSGCCHGACSGITCRISEHFVVETGAGSYPAGSFGYSVQFVGCTRCSSAALAGTACAAGQLAPSN
jgi:hypothetical protein